MLDSAAAPAPSSLNVFFLSSLGPCGSEGRVHPVAHRRVAAVLGHI